MKDENVAIVKMDATANDVPGDFNVRGFPTLYWKPKGGMPVPYNVSVLQHESSLQHFQQGEDYASNDTTAVS